jgi:GcrA cell cycle regulator
MGLAMTNGWTDERVTLLKKLWTDGLSASQIAKQLGGVTRNAVIGKVHRLGLAGRAAPSRPIKRLVTAAPRPRPVVVAAVVAAPVAPAAIPPQATVAAAAPRPAPHVAKPAKPVQRVREKGEIIGVLDLGTNMCKWPIGDPGDADFGFCGASCTAGAVYCEEHAAIAFQPHVSRRPGDRNKDDRAAAEVKRLARLANF